MLARNRPDETMALTVLQRFAPWQYANALHADKPDIWCMRPSIGVEVTWGYANHILASLGLNDNHDPHAALLRYHNAHHLPFADRTGHAYEYLQANGTISRQVTPPVSLGTGNDLLFAYRRKVAKVHQYRQFAAMNLFLHVFPTSADELHAFALAARQWGRSPFGTVYAYDGHTLWLVAMANGTVTADTVTWQ